MQVKRARFLANGHYHEGIWRDGVLVDETGREYQEQEVTWLPPVQPGKVIGLVLNFADHAAELGLERPRDPVLFIKPNSSLIGHRTPIIRPRVAREMHYETELAVVIGRRCRRVTAERALAVVRGYTIANDVTVRDFITNYFRPPVKAKGWDTFGPLGPWVAEGEAVDPGNLAVRTYVNGELRQSGHTRDLLWGVPQLIEYISYFMTLDPGDVILVGTPAGISQIYPGDRVRCEVEGVGALENPVVAEE